MRALCCGRYPKTLTGVWQLPMDTGPGPFATRLEIITALQSMFPHVDVDPCADLRKVELTAPPPPQLPDLEWLLITDLDLIIMVHLAGDDESCHELTLVLCEGGAKADEVAREILARFELRAWDRQTELFVSL